MQAIVMGGQEPSNEAWATDVANSLRLKRVFADESVFSYEHWLPDAVEPTIDVDREVVRLKEHVAQLETSCAIVAKSVGCLVAIRAFQEGAIPLERAVLMGIAAAHARELLAGYAVLTLCIQQKQDPAMGCEDLRQLLAGGNAKNCRVVGVPGSDGCYSKIDTITSLTQGWLIKAASEAPA